MIIEETLATEHPRPQFYRVAAYMLPVFSELTVLPVALGATAVSLSLLSFLCLIPI